MPFSMEVETEHKLSFFDIEVTRLTQFNTKLTFLKRTFPKIGFPEKFIDQCFKRFLDNTNLVEKVETIKRKKQLKKASAPIVRGIGGKNGRSPVIGDNSMKLGMCLI